jgi:hypothetical protein
MLIIGMLQTRILLDGRRTGEMNLIARIHQPIDQPIPIKGRLHNNAHNLLLVRLSELQDKGKISLI